MGYCQSKEERKSVGFDSSKFMISLEDIDSISNQGSQLNEQELYDNFFTALKS